MTDDLIQEGEVVSLVSQGGLVRYGEEVCRCVLRGILKSGKRKVKNPLSVGDRVRFQLTSAGEGAIEEVLPRTTALERILGSRGLLQVLAANTDQVLVIGSVREPNYRPGIVDRILVAAEDGGLTGVVCLNKIDLPGRKRDPRGSLDYLAPAGYATVYTSAETGEGVDELRTLLTGRRTVVLGHSGVGKSSLVQALAPDLALRVGTVSRKTKRGRHTTTAPEMFELFPGAYVVDTPGIREYMPAVEPARLAWCFPEIRPLLDSCHYPDCLHVQEPGCAVVEAVERGDIHPLRYEGYRNILRSFDHEGRWMGGE